MLESVDDACKIRRFLPCPDLTAEVRNISEGSDMMFPVARVWAGS